MRDSITKTCVRGSANWIPGESFDNHFINLVLLARAMSLLIWLRLTCSLNDLNTLLTFTTDIGNVRNLATEELFLRHS
jgi:hypothetical protein